MASIINYETIHQSNDSNKVAKFLMENRLLNDKLSCKNCENRLMLLKTRKNQIEPWWRCTKCTSWKSIRGGSYFEFNRAALTSMMKLIYAFINQLTISAASELSGCAYQTTLEYFQKFRYKINI